MIYALGVLAYFAHIERIVAMPFLNSSESNRELVLAFVSEACVLGYPALQTDSAVLSGAWFEWCRRRGIEDGTSQDSFGRHLAATYGDKIARIRVRRGKQLFWVYRGIALKPAD